ncbi:DUF397 domain-containing protein [Streptomyces sp. NPDC020951]|uniref:DUF397 domain-containing protein n=1 Tax=Streptomyces sp. NPDC020951 TaxID=3365104 RepID=UPI00379AEF5B
MRAATPDNWQKSSFSGFGDGNNCLELASTPTALHLRESDTPTTVLTASRAPLAHLLAGIRTDTVVRVPEST